MSEGFPYADLLLLGAVAVFIALRLRSTLGRKMGFDGTQNPAGPYAPATPARPAALAAKSAAADAKEAEEEKKLLSKVESSAAATGLAAIKARAADFSLREFLEGARIAFEMVVEAFSKGDSDTLKRLLSTELFAQFSAELDAQQKSGEKHETTLVSIESQDVAEAEVSGAQARLTVRFVSEQVSVVRGADKKILSGDPSQVARVEDHWTFERNMDSRDPNWQIVAT